MKRIIMESKNIRAFSRAAILHNGSLNIIFKRLIISHYHYLTSYFLLKKKC